MSEVILLAEGEFDISPIGLWLDGKLVARILSRDQADVLSLQGTGLIVAKLEISSGKGKLELSLIAVE